MNFFALLADAQADSRWRKTIDGWEHQPEWLCHTTWLDACGQFPPLCAAVLMVLLSVGVLLSVDSMRLADR